MARYFFRVITQRGDEEKGYFLAATNAEALKHLTTHHQEILCLKRAFRPWAFLSPRLRLSRPHKILFFKGLLLFTQAGVPLTESLHLISKGSSGVGRKIARHLYVQLESGVAFSTIVQAIWPQDPLTVAFLHMGEKTGQMTHALDQIVTHLSQAQALQQQWRKAIRYPLAVLGMMGVTVTLLCHSLVPALIPFVAEGGGELPVLTRFLIWLSQGSLPEITSLWGGGLLMGGLFLLVRATLPQARSWGERFLLKTPYLGDMALSITLARFFHLWHTLTTSHVNLPEALEYATHGILWPSLAHHFQEIKEPLLNGQPLAMVFKGRLGIREEALYLLHVGEKTGQLAHTLSQISQFYQQRAIVRQERFLTFLEPLCLGFLGIILLGIVGGTFLPLYEQMMTGDWGGSRA
jgi:type IV pilus assembly protein PilC